MPAAQNFVYIYINKSTFSLYDSECEIQSSLLLEISQSKVKSLSSRYS